MEEGATHDMVYAKDGADVHTGVDIAAAVEGVEDDAVLALVAFVDEDRLLVLLRDEHGRLARRAQRVDHDVVREHVELLLLLPLNVRLARHADPIIVRHHHHRRQSVGHRCTRREGDLQVNEARSTDVGRDELGGRLDGTQEQGEVTGRRCAQAELVVQNMAARPLSASLTPPELVNAYAPGEGDDVGARELLVGHLGWREGVIERGGVRGKQEGLLTLAAVVL